MKAEFFLELRLAKIDPDEWHRTRACNAKNNSFVWNNHSER